jgi:Legume lectin domain
MHHAIGASSGWMRRAKTRAVLALILGLFGLLAGRAQATPVISYPNFSSTSGLQLNGVAKQVGASLRLTPAEENKSGTAFSLTQIATSGSFETEFELRMHESNTVGPGTFGFPADGIAFVLQPKSAEEVGLPGGDLGYAGISPSAVVQFDIYKNTYDPSVPYISFMENGNAQNHLAQSETPLPFQLYSETPVMAWVVYNSATHTLSVYAAPAPSSKPEKALFTYQVNLVELLNSPSTFAGFTAGTGSGDAVQEICNWQLSTEGGLAGPGSACPGSGSGPSPSASPSPAPTTHGSATSVICNLIVAIASDTCTATVGDVDVPAAITPTGTVSFTSSNGGVFSAGNTCNLMPTPNSPDTASCSVQFLPPTNASTAPAITASYGGDAHHGSSIGHTFYPSTGELSGDIELSPAAVVEGAAVGVSVGCQFPCSVGGELGTGTGPGEALPGYSLAPPSGDHAVIAKTKKKHGKKKKKAKSVVLGTGSLTLSKPGKGTLQIKLTPKAKSALKKARKSFKANLTITIKTASGTLVGTKTEKVTISPAKAKHKGKHGKKGKRH